MGLNSIISPLGSGGVGAYEFVVSAIKSDRIRLNVGMDARSYVESLPVDTLWIEDSTASAAIINHIGPLITSRDYGMFIVADTANRACFLRRGDRAVQGVQGQPNIKIVGDKHYLWFEWKARPALQSMGDCNGPSDTPDYILACTRNETFVTKPFIYLRRTNGEDRIGCLPVARIDDGNMIIRDLWITPKDGTLHWREERLSPRPASFRTRSLSILNRLLWSLGADFEPFCLGYTSQVSLGNEHATFKYFNF